MTAERDTKIWVPGGTGMLGRAVADDLRGRGIEPVATGREVDVADREAIWQFLDGARPSHIVNCAAYTAVDDAESDADAAERVNATGAGHLAALAGQLITRCHPVFFGVNFIFEG